MAVKTKARKGRKTATVADSLRGIRYHDAAVAGDSAFQGDIIFVVLGKLPAGAKIRTNRQLAEGTTMGSRHVVEGGAVYDCEAEAVAKEIKRLTGKSVATDFIGPVFTGGTVTHPQHEHHVFRDDCIVAVVFQRNVDAERRIIRARD